MPAGLAFALVAWFGARAACAVFLGSALAVGWAWLRGSFAESAALALAWADVTLTAVEALVAWEIYRRARGTRGLADPRSAILFLLLVPGAVAVLFALLRAGLTLAARPGPAFPLLFVESWLGRALTLASLAPPLLVGMTATLVRRGWTPAEVVDEAPVAHQGMNAARAEFGDWLEIGGLAAGAGVLSLLLCLGPGSREPSSWQLWGPPMLLIVWAGVRQGMLGGTLAAAAATALPLLALTGVAATAGLFLLEANLLAECAAALLVSASSTWIRLSEARYRRVVGHVPVVLYSARIVADSAAARTPKAEVTLVSAASQTMFSCPPDQLLGDYNHWLERIHPQDREILLAALSQLTRQQQPVSCEYRLARAEKKEDSVTRAQAALRTPNPALAGAVSDRWLRDTLAPQFDSSGRLVGWEGVVVDISEQRALADDLRRTSTMFHTLVANLPAGVVFVQGRSGRPVLVNARARQLLGRREEVSASVDHFPEVYHLQKPDGSPYPAEELPVVQALRLGRPASCDDVVVVRADGRRVPLITWAAPVDLGGPVRDAAAVWVIEDLTALHQAESARRESEGRLRAVVEAMGEGLVVLDRRGLVMDCNPTACSLLGESAERLRGQPLDALPWTCLREDGSALPADERPWHAVLKSGRPVRNLLLGLAPAAAPAQRMAPVVRWVLVNAMPLGSGTPNGGAVTTFADVTAFRKAQEVIRHSEERYRTLVEALPFMLLQVDPTGKVVYANPATRELSGYELEEFADPAQWEALILPESLQLSQDMLVEGLAGRSSRGELRYRAKDGKEHVAYAISQPQGSDGNVTGVTTLLFDVTRERQLEQELERSRRLELIGRLASGVAHDFNNLLTVVLGVSQLAGTALPADHPVHDDLRRITAAGEQASSLASQLLAFARQQKVALRRVDVNVVTRRTLDLLRGTVRRDVTVTADLAAAELVIEADETQLQQVLMNLCLNARDAMPHGGIIHIQTAAPDDDWVRLTVQDEGEGMTEQVKRSLFDAFFTTKEQGTGLGLAVVQQIVEGFGGRIEVSSELGRGSRFDVWLPRMQE